MEKELLSVGIDIGTSTTQLVISKLTVRNTASAFTVPKLAITDKDILYRSRIHFTPLRSDTVIDTEAIQRIVDEFYGIQFKRTGTRFGMGTSFWFTFNDDEDTTFILMSEDQASRGRFFYEPVDGRDYSDLCHYLSEITGWLAGGGA